jgi:hypothetical protein
MGADGALIRAGNSRMQRFAKLTKVNAAVRLTYDAIATAPLSRV